jgi:tryptophan synthase beta chain
MNPDDHDDRLQRRHALSALMDGDGIDAELAFGAWRDDEGVRADWHAYHVIGEAIDAFHLLSELEGIVPALETAHALAHVAHVAPRMGQGEAVLVSLSGRGDKDVNEVARLEGVKL